MQYLTLNDGNKMPILGYGVYQVEPAEAQRCVEDAISVGYRLIDTAQAYQNEEGVGAAVKTALSGGVKREELFITTKLWISDAGEEKALKAFDASMKKLGLDYLDLYLIHQPYGDIYGSWRAMKRLKDEGRVRSIGVSNFNPGQIMYFAINNEIKPAINQIECNPFYQQLAAQANLKELGIAMQSWAPFGEGRKDMFGNAVLKMIAQKQGRSVAQVILRWLVQRGIVVIPKSVSKERMAENFNIFDFSLSEADMQTIAGLDDGTSLFFDHGDPQIVKMLNNLSR
jgi:morphine 6-dehydrogenase (fragment)